VTEQSEEYAFYCTSAAPKQYGARELLQAIRDRWGASENGAHYRRDVSLGEDASRIGKRTGAYVITPLRLLGPHALGSGRRTNSVGCPLLPFRGRLLDAGQSEMVVIPGPWRVILRCTNYGLRA